jgi:DNA primase
VKEGVTVAPRYSPKYSPRLLRELRNDVDIARLVADVLELPWKSSEGYFRFLCPLCSEFNTATNPKTNLARCFRCQRNFNPIDMVMTVNRCNFVNAVELLLLLPR